jgi:hypothetical protein
MKISEMSTEKAADVMVKIMQPIRNILQDEEVIPAIKKMTEAESSEDIFAALLSETAPLLLKKHTSDFCTIIAVLSEKTVDKVMKQKFLATMNDIRNCMDKDLIDFFKSSGNARITEEE